MSEEFRNSWPGPWSHKSIIAGIAGVVITSVFVATGWMGLIDQLARCIPSPVVLLLWHVVAVQTGILFAGNINSLLHGPWREPPPSEVDEEHPADVIEGAK